MSNTAGSTNLGSAWSCITDLAMPSKLVTGFHVVAEAIARRWQTPRGGLIDDPNYGFDLTDYVGDDLSKADLSRIAASAKAEALKDERVQACDVVLTMINGVMAVTAKVTTSAGPFTMVVSVSALSVSLLQVSP